MITGPLDPITILSPLITPFPSEKYKASSTFTIVEEPDEVAAPQEPMELFAALSLRVEVVAALPALR